MPQISPKAIIEPGAKLADDVRVEAFCYIGPDVRIASGCVIANNVTIDGHTELGERCRVFPLAVIGAAPSGATYAPHCRIGNANDIREHVTLYGGPEDRPTSVGNDNLVMIDSTVGASATLGNHCIVANLTHIGAGAEMEDYTHTSAFTQVADGVRVGAYTFINGYATVDRNAPPFAMLHGSPYRVRGVNRHKLKACGFGEADIRLLKDVFRDLFNGEGRDPSGEQLDALAGQHGDHPHVLRLLDALRPGTRAS